MPQQLPKVDRRLLGHWRSDRRKTLDEFVWSPRTKPTARKFFSSLFGHLRQHYTPRYVYSDLKGFRERGRYEVVAIDADSVAIQWGVTDSWPGQILHIHFEGDHYWISCGRQREWFKRVRPKRRSVTQKPARNRG